MYMEIIKDEFVIGATEPFKILQISDLHLNFVSLFDKKRIRKLAKKRKQVYSHSKNVLQAASELSKKLNAPIFNTGDMNDFISRKNLRYIKDFTDNNDCFFVCGNHDFRPMGGMEYDCEHIRALVFDKVQALYKNDIMFSARVINGINFVGVDDAYYKFSQKNFDKLKAEVNKGLPIVLLMHIPLYTEDLFYSRVDEKRKYASLTAVPDEMMSEYPPKRLQQQKTDSLTQEVVDYIKKCDTIKLILAGHTHKRFETVLDGRLPQWVIPIDAIREITFR